MLARSDPTSHHCIECGRPYSAEGFAYYEGRSENGAAYWSDRGLLCSPKCSLVHHNKRAAEGSLQQDPAPEPFMPTVKR